jgi:hypothetical protein
MMTTTNETREMFKERASLFAKGRYQESIAGFSITIEMMTKPSFRRTNWR